ncbi:hypothetical protein K505DRAFT_366583 [Melanomma pulvis-pyrius CBS 109.77]|uniref:Uncharacterized protein n=1 Tax=Melanomma pulvis-pyrius CBS 109.77 TaxID=1314802 RepID=A0A6A6WVU3_9PLEO|nr:hypothetical protein K505DRAFT_366583 [Melanomma pulvis-pyrius CBS 109.77]
MVLLKSGTSASVVTEEANLSGLAAHTFQGDSDHHPYRGLIEVLVQAPASGVFPGIMALKYSWLFGAEGNGSAGGWQVYLLVHLTRTVLIRLCQHAQTCKTTPRIRSCTICVTLLTVLLQLFLEFAGDIYTPLRDVLKYSQGVLRAAGELPGGATAEVSRMGGKHCPYNDHQLFMARNKVLVSEKKSPQLEKESMEKNYSDLNKPFVNDSGGRNLLPFC